MAVFQRALGHDFSDVRVHTDAESAAGTGRYGAVAYVGGSDMASLSESVSRPGCRELRDAVPSPVVRRRVGWRHDSPDQSV
ncbi:DUF4157 domain-containing protein [Streptomyces sp. NPDC086554]|uniref:eCIS core domain-containing protein n=1 Tax=Streptomyces sp. NPDC086554 TaxID=3154864 RepID=UPI003413D6FF